MNYVYRKNRQIRRFLIFYKIRILTGVFGIWNTKIKIHWCFPQQIEFPSS